MSIVVGMYYTLTSTVCGVYKTITEKKEEIKYKIHDQSKIEIYFIQCMNKQSEL